jgi:quercetin dioxygenase-like cupin family protein
MKRHALLAILALGVLTLGMPARCEPPLPILPDALSWLSPPGNPAVQGAWVLGDEHSPGPYILRVRLAADGRIAPHTHPDTRNTTVLSGTLYVGFGTVFDESAMVALPPGSVYVAPAGLAHFVRAKDGATLYQEAGVGPTATVPVEPH